MRRELRPCLAGEAKPGGKVGTGASFRVDFKNPKIRAKRNLVGTNKMGKITPGFTQAGD